MGRTQLKVRFIICLMALGAFLPVNSFSQCLGGFFAGAITPGINWQAVGCAWGGDYYTFTATAGIPYTFSLCPPTPGSTPFNSQLTILDNSGTPIIGGYNDNACVGGGSHIQSWIPPVTGTYRILINENNCMPNTTCCDLAFKQERPIGPGKTCANPYVVGTLPLSLNNMATCGYDNDYNQFTSACPTPYMDGEDFVFEYTTTGPECIDIRTSNTFTWTGLLIYDGCPDAVGTSCLGGAVSGTGSPVVANFNITAAGTYYFVISTWPNPQCTPFDITIENCPIPGPGLTCANPRPVGTLPYTQVGLTTCAHGDDYQPTDTCRSEYMGGEDFTFTYNSPGNECINIALSNTSTWVGIHVTDDCPNNVGANCIAQGGNSGGNTRLRDVNLVAAGTYYITISTWPNPQCTPFDVEIINCPPDCGRNGPAGDACTSAQNVTGLDTICGTSEASYGIDTAGTNLNSAFCGSLDNESFFSFVADTTDIEVEFFNVTNCVYNFGLQAQIYSTPDCSTFTAVSGCYNPQNTNPGTLFATGLVVGETYYLMVDGWAGDVCDYEVAINGASTALPVELSDIYAMVNGSQVSLSWETSSESQNKGFYIERGQQFESTEKFAVAWETVGFVAGAGTTTLSSTYNFKDDVEFGGEPMFYRLRQVDFDGMSWYSDVVAVSPDMPKRDALVALYPNPATDEINIEYMVGEDQGAVILQIYSNTGQLITERNMGNESPGFHSQTVTLEDIPGGVYLYNLRVGSNSFPGKITVIH